MSASYDLRLVGYTPLGNRIGVIPDLGITVTTAASGPTLSATVSTAVYGTLPVSLEVGVEYWHSSNQTWTEPRDCRFAITQQQYDDRDLTGTTTLTGIGVGAYLMAAAALAGVEPYVNTTGTSEVAATSTTVSLSNDTFTWPSHIFADGDRIHITSNGSANKKLKVGLYFVRAPTTNTFKISTTPLGTAKTGMGTASNIHAERVVTRIVFSGSHQFARSSQVVTVGGSALGLSDGTAYYVVNPTTATIQLSNHPNGVPITLSAASTNISQVYRNLDGQRIFTNAHPGVVLSSAFNEAKARGWGVGPTDEVTHGWTTTTDSTGAAWTSMADDPTTPGISVGFQPGTPMTTMLQFMLDNQYAEWYMAGRIINVVNYGTGTDHTTGSAPKRIGTEASQLPVTVDLTNMRNSVIVRGTGPILREKDGTTGAWGRLETYETASGITTKSTADKQALTDIAANGNPQIGYSLTEMAQEAQYLPGLHFSRGDWVAVQLAGSGWTRLRVIGWTLAKAANGAITVTNVLQYQKRHIVAKALKASVSASAGISDSGTVTSPILESDNRKPSAPVVSGVTLVGSFNSDNSAVCTATVTWNGVTADINGGDITSALYQVWLRPEASDNGAPVGSTAGLTFDIGSLPPGQTYAVSVRAQSDQGEWGEFSNEAEFVTTYTATVPLVPTAPTLSGRLGQARVSWDGNLVDPITGNVAASDPTQAGFAYVSVWYSTTNIGPWTRIGSNMGNAGAVSISALSIGTTYWFALAATNTLGVTSAVSTPTSYTIVGVTGPDLVANSVTANSILAGAITSDKLDIGTVPASATPTDRIPLPLPNSTYWSLVVAGTIALPDGKLNNVTSVSTGLTFVGTLSLTAQLGVTAQNAVPASGAVFISIASTAATVFPQVVERNAAGTVIGTYNIAPSVKGVRYSFTASAVNYSVKLTTPAGVAITDTVTSCHVFEVISTMGIGQGVELSPAGLQFFDNNGNLQMDLTTGSQQLFGVFDTTGGDPVAQAFIDTTGDAFFNGALTVNGNASVGGVLLTDETSPSSILNSNPNGSTWDPNIVPLLDRFPRGVIYDVTWDTTSGITLSTQYERIAQDQFTLEDGRQYMICVQIAGMQVNNSGGVNSYVELQFGLTPNTSIQSGQTVNRADVFSADKGYWAMPPIIYTAATGQATVDTNNRIVPAGVPIYWQVNWNQSTTPSSGQAITEFGFSRGLTVIDVGSSNLTRPVNGMDALANTTDRTTSGASSGSTSGGTTATSKTVTFTANSSRTWNNGGSTIVVGTGQYTNGSAMYYGTGASAMGSWFGNFKDGGGHSLATILSGKTVSKAVLTVENTYTAFSSATVTFGTAATTTAPSTIGSPASNVFNATFSQGQKKAMTLSGAICSGLASTGVGSFVLGVSSSSSNYSYYHGASQSSPPTLTVTYH